MVLLYDNLKDFFFCLKSFDGNLEVVGFLFLVGC